MSLLCHPLPNLPLAAGEGGVSAAGFIITGVIVLGIFAQWLAWRLKVPSILLLLAFGFLAGPIAEWSGVTLPGTDVPVYLDIDRVVETPVLLTIVSLAVGLILFEGGLSLTWSEIRGVRPAVISLVTVGAAVTWILSSLAARFILDLPWDIALLLGAILVVTGPTVIGPLIRFVRPTGSVGKVLKWEGIVIDPVGALLAVLVFEAILAGSQLGGGTAWDFAWGAIKASVVGTAFGIGMGYLLVFMISRRLTPDHLQIPMALGFATLAFTASNYFAPEAGLFATTVMGILLANQKRARVAHILEFKETLVVLMIGLLFITLSARLDLVELQQINWWRAGLFLLVLIALVRPLSIFASTAGRLGGTTSFKDKLFLSWMAPRGIVAAAIASVFGISLQEAGVPQAELLTPYIFLIIVVTVAVYGLTCVWVARSLDIANPLNAGFLIAGANPMARQIGKALQEAKTEVLLVDLNYANIQRARLEGLPTLVANVLSPQTHEAIELTGIGRLLALTPNNEVNSLAVVQHGRHFGRSNVFQLTTEGQRKRLKSLQKGEAAEKRTDVTGELKGRIAFGESATFDHLDDLINAGASVRHTKLTREFTFDDWKRLHEYDAGRALILFVVTELGAVHVVSADDTPAPKAGQTIVALTFEPSEPLKAMHAEERVARDEEAKAKKDKKDKKDAGSSIAGIPVPGILRSPS
jgi:NhaP-type Na+/H+ or K+/H+ antiporter